MTRPGVPGAPAAALAPLDRLTLLYLAAPTLALALSFRGGRDPIAAWPLLVVAHGLIVALVLLAPRARRAGAMGRFVGDWYPLLLLAGLYGEISVFTLQQGVVHDAAIQALEQRVFGGQPSAAWIRWLPHPGLSWVMHTCYLAYYGILAAAPLGLWAARRHDAARRTILAIMVTFYLCYPVFLFFPVAGPRYFFPQAVNAATAIWPAQLAQTLLDRADSWGAAFPSSHVAAAVVATGMAWRGWAALGRVLAPVTAGLTLGAVYGQFHYGVDAVVGLGLGLAVLWGVAWWGSRGRGSGSGLR